MIYLKYQFSIYFLLILTKYSGYSDSVGIPIPPDNGEKKPDILVFVNDKFSSELCSRYKKRMEDYRCQIVLFNWYKIHGEYEIYKFRFGKLEFIAYRWRTYRNDQYDLVEFMVKL